MDIYNVVIWLVGLLNNKGQIHCFPAKFCLVMKLISQWMDSSISKIVVSGVMKILGLIHDKSLHPQKVTVWCAFWANGIIGTFFIEDDALNAVTVNAELYQSMLSDFL